MKALLDTLTFLWWITDDPCLSARAREILSDGRNILFLSAVSGWEIRVKARLGRLTLPDKPGPFILEQLYRNAFDSLPIQLSHALHVFSLPDFHRDPFDRILIAQSQLERLPILTSDPQISEYPVEVIW